MPPKALLLGITVLAIVIIIGGVAYTLVESQSSPTPSNSGNGQQTPTGSTTPEIVMPEYPEDNSNDTSSGTNVPEQTAGASVQEQIRDQGMAYLKTNKPETAPLMGNLTWYGGFYDLSPPGTEQYMYYTRDGFWSITVESQDDSGGNYTITGTYFNAATMTVTFKETYQNGAFTLVNYSSQRNQGLLPMP